MDELYSKRLPVYLKCTDKEDRKVFIQLRMELQTITNPLTKKELLVHLTDEKDLFFLYALCLGEDDFQSLKVQQGLLVDFASFPQKFIDLLNMCLQEEHRDSPKFVLHFVTGSGGGERSTAVLNVVETNPFKHLVHLSLKFLPGSDADIKKYLAACLKQFKDTNSLLQQKLEHTTKDLSQRLQQAQDLLSAKSSQLESLKAEWDARTLDLHARHKEEMAAEREKAMQTQGSLQQRLERDRRDLEQAHTKIVKQMEARLFELEAANKELTDKRFKSESLIRELKSKVGVLEEEVSRAKQDVVALRKHNTALDSESHEKEKVVSQLQTRVAVLEQEVKDKEQVVNRTTDLYNSSQDAKRKVEEDLEKRGKEVSKLESKVKVMGEELKKGNDIIKKLQAEIKNYHSKVKLRTQIATEQERLLKEKDQELESLRQDLASTADSLKQKTDQNSSMADDLQRKTKALEESRALLKTNENVIQWLNKQINEQQLAGRRVGPFEMPATSSSLRPNPAGMHNFSAPSYGSAGVRSDGVVQNGPQTLVGGPQPYHQPHRSAQQVQYNPGPVSAARKSALPIPSTGRAGHPPSIPEEKRSPASNHSSPASTHSADKENNPPLDPKYFQKRDDAIAVRGLNPGSIPATSAQSHHSSHHPLHSSHPPHHSSHPPLHSSQPPVHSSHPLHSSQPPVHSSHPVHSQPAFHSSHPPLHSSQPHLHSSQPPPANSGPQPSTHMPVSSVRLSQQMIVPKTSQPPLASAYFPAHAKPS